MGMGDGVHGYPRMYCDLAVLSFYSSCFSDHVSFPDPHGIVTNPSPSKNIPRNGHLAPYVICNVLHNNRTKSGVMLQVCWSMMSARDISVQSSICRSMLLTGSPHIICLFSWHYDYLDKKVLYSDVSAGTQGFNQRKAPTKLTVCPTIVFDACCRVCYLVLDGALMLDRDELDSRCCTIGWSAASFLFGYLGFRRKSGDCC